MNSIMIALIIASSSFKLPPGLLNAVCYVESKNNPAAIHKEDGPEDSVGLCQMHLSTAQMMGYHGSVAQLQHNPAVNAYYAAKYLRHQIDRYHGDYRLAVGAYNAGSYRPYTKPYINKVFTAWGKKL